MEFPELFQNQNLRIAEVGCGAGNTFFPLKRQLKSLNSYIYAFDYSEKAIQVVQQNPEYDEKYGKSFVYDITSPCLPKEIEPESLDYIICIFVLSALHPNQLNQTMSNIKSLLKPNGFVLIRDYGQYDLTQIRMKKSRYLEPNFYIRGDGTRVYFFSLPELQELFKGFTEHQLHMDRRLLVNRAKKMKMFRNWIQAKFQKS